MNDNDQVDNFLQHRKRFLPQLSHEARSLLASMVAIIDLLRGGEYGPLPASVDEGLTLAAETAARLRKLLDDSMELERLELGSSPHRPARIALKELTASVVAGLGPDWRALALRLPRGELHVIADAAGLARAMGILLANAAGFSPPGTTVEIACELRDEGKVRWSVADRGPGVPAWFEARIFGRFERAGHVAAGASPSGIGLGLCIARAAVRRDGGEVGFSNRPGGGAEFHIDLPAEVLAGEGRAL